MGGGNRSVRRLATWWAGTETATAPVETSDVIVAGDPNGQPRSPNWPRLPPGSVMPPSWWRFASCTPGLDCRPHAISAMGKTLCAVAGVVPPMPTAGNHQSPSWLQLTLADDQPALHSGT